MFTGIVQGMALVEEVESKDAFSRVVIALPEGRAGGIKIGASVAINGTCLTVTEIKRDSLAFDIMVETLRATNLDGLREGGEVNYKRSARFGDEIGGHTVSGHISCTASVPLVEDLDNNTRMLTFELPDDKWMKYILPKGFIAVNGCSLTIGNVVGRTFCVWLIPETLRVTVFGSMQGGESVNIEIEAQTQAIVDTVERVLANMVATGTLATPTSLSPTLPVVGLGLGL